MQGNHRSIRWLAVAFALGFTLALSTSAAAATPGATPAASPAPVVRPAGAPQVSTLLLEDFRGVFAADAGKVRLLLLFSPT